MTTQSGASVESNTTKALLWFGVLSGPVAWFLHLAISYSLVAYVCEWGTWALHFVTLAAVPLPVLGFWIGWRYWRRAKDQMARGAPAVGRTRLMSAGAVVFSAYFLLMVLVAAAANFAYGGCE